MTKDAIQERVFGENWFTHSNDSVTLFGSSCRDCESSWFPKRSICPNCLGEHLTDLRLSDIGEVYSFTKLHVVAKGFEKPLTIAYIDFPEGVRVCGQIEGRIEIGSKVQATFGRIRTDLDGTQVFSYKFKAFS
jgi:uncharacterized protein